MTSLFESLSVLTDAEAIKKLEESTAPDPWIRWVNGKVDPELPHWQDDLQGFKRAGRKAVDWLKGALKYAYMSKPIKEKATKLLQTYWFTANLAFMDLFDDLKNFAKEYGQVLGEEMRKYCEEHNLVEQLGDLGKIKPHVNKGKIKKSQEYLVPAPKLRGQFGMELGQGTIEEEVIYVHVLRMIALAVNDQYQQVVQNIASKHNGKHRGVPIKGVARMYSKLSAENDHRVLPENLKADGITKRTGQNIDICRNAVTFDEIVKFREFVFALSEVFDGAARIKNAFGFPFEQAEAQMHYRAMMMNVVWPPVKGDYARTFAELEQQAGAMWDDYVSELPTDPTFSPSQWLRHATAARAHLRDLASQNAKLNFIVEVQVLLKPYLHGRKKTHLIYKVLRAETGDALTTEFKKPEKKADHGKRQAEIQQRELNNYNEQITQNRGNARVLGYPNLFNASMYGYERAVQALLDAGATVNVDNGQGYIALMQAAVFGHGVVVEMLLKHGADVNKVTDGSGYAALYFSSQNGHLDCVTHLLNYGADINKADSQGHTPLYIACQNGHMDIIRLLINRGADLNKARFNDGNSPLYVAAFYGHSDVVKLLHDNGVDPRAKNSNGYSPFFVACQGGHVNVANYIMPLVDVNELGGSGASPLYIAAQRDHVEVVKILLKAGANKSIGFHGSLPIDAAREKNYRKVVALLQ